MSENRISELEKEVEVLGVTLKHLIERMEKDTEASIENQKAQVETQKAIVGLTLRIDNMLENFDYTKEMLKEHGERIVELEKKEAVNESGKEFRDAFKKAMITGLVSAIFIGCAFVASIYFERAG